MDSLTGDIRFNGLNELVGWVHDHANPAESVHCALLVNGAQVKTFFADIPRPDLEAKYAAYRKGFIIDISEIEEINAGDLIELINVETGQKLPTNRLVVPAPPTQSTAPRLEPGNSESALVIQQMRHGVFILNRFDQGVDTTFLTYGEYAESEVRLLKELAPARSTVLDVGANIGALAIPLAQHVQSGGKVYAFEPQPNVFHRLCGNVALNGLTNIVCMQQAAGAEAGTTFLPHVDYCASHSSGGVQVQRQPQGLRVPILPLDDLDFSGDHVSVVKIDVEGLEDLVVAGSMKLIADQKPSVYFECCSRSRFRKIVSALTPVGYDFYWHPAPLFQKDNFFGTVEDKYYGFGINSNILAVPNRLLLSDEHGLYRVENEAEFWPAERFPDQWRDKIAYWASMP